MARSLWCSADLEPERVVVVEHPPAPIGQDPALGCPSPERCDDLLDVEPGLHRQDDAFGHAEVGPGEDHLVDRLDRLAGADRPDMGDGPAECREDRASPFDVVRLATDEDRQGRVAGALAPARDGRIDHPQALLAQARSEVPAARRGDRRAIDDERAGPSPGGHAVRPEQDGLDVGRVRDAQDDDVGGARRRGRGGGPRDPEFVQVGGASGSPVPGGDREAGASQVGRHGGAHRAQAEEGDAVHQGAMVRRGRVAARLPAGAINRPATASPTRSCPGCRPRSEPPSRAGRCPAIRIRARTRRHRRSSSCCNRPDRASGHTCRRTD